jgi:hypothetical protein
MGDNLVPNGLSRGFKVITPKSMQFEADLLRCGVTHRWPDRFCPARAVAVNPARAPSGFGG